ncbi:MAG: glycosyltransferase family 4 protein [Planctomycetota bacterium]
MRVLYTNFHSEWGGQALQVLLLAKTMRARGHSVVVFSPPESVLAERAGEAGLLVDTSCAFGRGFRPLPFLRDVRTLRARLRDGGGDIVHAHGSQDNWIAAAALWHNPLRALLFRTKHNSYPVARHALNRWLYNRANAHTIAVAETIREEMCSDGFVAPERVSVIHAGLDDRFIQEPRTPPEVIRREIGVPLSAPLIGLVGRLAPDKGQDTLVRAAPLVREAFPDARFVLVGTGGDWDRIRALIREGGLEGVVHWTGFRKDIASVTAALDVSVLAARDCDASSTVVKEAMALGVPVVASRVGGTSEILEQGSCGLLIKPGDAKELSQAIRLTLSDKAQALRRAVLAQDRVRRYVATAMAQETEALYERVLAGQIEAKG